MNSNFKKIKGIGTLINELKKNENPKVRVWIINCLKEFTKDYENIYFFKVYACLNLLLDILRFY